MATYNGAHYIRDQLDSILSQIPNDGEVIVSDDSSTDDTVDIVRSFCDRRLRIVENQQRRGPIGNFENALRHARHELIFLSDQDDVWSSNKVEVMVKFLGMADLVQCDARLIGPRGEEIVPSVFRAWRSGPGLVKNLRRNTYSGNSMAFHARVREWALPFPEGIGMHDWWLGLTAEIYGSTYFIDQILTSWRKHGSNTSPVGSRSQSPMTRRISWRLTIVANLISRYWSRQSRLRLDSAGV